MKPFKPDFSTLAACAAALILAERALPLL